MKRLKILVSILVIILASYFLLNSIQLFEENILNGQVTSFDPAGNNNHDRNFKSSEPASINLKIESDGSVLIGAGTGGDKGVSNAGRRLEIFGLVVDKYGQPIGNAMVAEERYFISTRTGSDGKYKILIAMPNNQYPVLRFLRSGYEDKRIEIDAGVLKQESVLELDVTLDDDLDSISIDGWVGNDIGAGLGGLKIQISSRDKRGMVNVFHTVFSDERGYFTFEGIRSGDLYRLTVLSPPEYLYYVDEAFSVSHNTPQLIIVLESLRFIDIDGMIVNSKAEPIPNFEIYISNISTGTHARKIETDSSGFFSLRKFPAGEIILSTQGPEYFKITGLTLVANEYRNLRLVVDKGDYYLLGWVSDESGVPLAKALVTLNSEIQAGAIEYLSYRVTGTDNAGNFNFDSVGSGSHLITVEAPGFNRKEIIHRFESQTDKVHITLSRIR